MGRNQDHALWKKPKPSPMQILRLLIDFLLSVFYGLAHGHFQDEIVLFIFSQLKTETCAEKPAHRHSALGFHLLWRALMSRDRQLLLFISLISQIIIHFETIQGWKLVPFCALCIMWAHFFFPLFFYKTWQFDKTRGKGRKWERMNQKRARENLGAVKIMQQGAGVHKHINFQSLKT